jgi:RNAse (barnase) inhibitor barstar
VTAPGEVVEEEDWVGDGVSYRVAIVRRDDGLFMLRLLCFYPEEATEYGDTPAGWGVLPVAVSLADTIERARQLAEEERRSLPVVTKRVRQIDGSRLDSLRGFWDEVETKLIAGREWGRNLDAFNDILRGGFGTPEDGFVLRWRHSERSRRVLGYAETLRWLEAKARGCHPDNVKAVENDIAAARRGQGPTLFDIILEIVRTHGAGGAEEGDGVELDLL